MALCERCGSLQVVRARAKLADKVLAFFTAKRLFVCRRCGWRGRRAWTDADLARRPDYGSIGGGEIDPALVVLDDRKHASTLPAKDVVSANAEFDLSALDFATTAPGESKDPNAETVTTVASRKAGRRSVHRRRKRSRRRKIVSAIAMTALAMFLLVMFGLTGSCGGGPADRSNTFLPSSSLAATRFTSASVISPRSPRIPRKVAVDMT